MVAHPEAGQQATRRIDPGLAEDYEESEPSHIRRYHEKPRRFDRALAKDYDESDRRHICRRSKEE